MSKFGWILPNKTIVGCGPAGHFDIIAKTPELLAMIPDFEIEQAKVDSVRQSCEELAAREGNSNAEWHTYESANDHFRWDSVTALYREGCLRFGYISGDWCLEGAGEVYLQLKPFLDSEFPNHEFTSRNV